MKQRKPDEAAPEKEKKDKKKKAKKGESHVNDILAVL